MIATISASARNGMVAVGMSLSTVLIILAPWSRSPSENPVAPRTMPKRLVIILEPMAGQHRLISCCLKPTSRQKKLKLKGQWTAKPSETHLMIEVTTETIESAKSSHRSSMSSLLCRSSE